MIRHKYFHSSHRYCANKVSSKPWSKCTWVVMMARQARRSGFESTLLYKKRINNEKRLWFCHSKLDKTFVWKFHSKTNKCVFSLKHSSSLIFEASRRLASGDKTQEHQHHYRWRCNDVAGDHSPSAIRAEIWPHERELIDFDASPGENLASSSVCQTQVN